MTSLSFISKSLLHDHKLKLSASSAVAGSIARLKCGDFSAELPLKSSDQDVTELFYRLQYRGRAIHADF